MKSSFSKKKNEIDIEFFAQILFVKILGPTSFALHEWHFSGKTRCRIMQPDVFNVSVEAKKLGIKKKNF